MLRSESSDTFEGLDFDIEPKLLISTAQLAKSFCVTPATIARWAQNGTMPDGMRIGGRRLWNIEYVRRWIREGCPCVDGHERD